MIFFAPLFILSKLKPRGRRDRLQGSDMEMGFRFHCRTVIRGELIYGGLIPDRTGVPSEKDDNGPGAVSYDGEAGSPLLALGGSGSGGISGVLYIGLADGIYY